MADKYSLQDGILAPASSAAAVTPSDTVDIAFVTRALYVGTSGTVVAIIDGVAVTFVGVAGGSILPIRCSRVNSTSTTASNIVALA
jgi:hypothetical protein